MPVAEIITALQPLCRKERTTSIGTQKVMEINLEETMIRAFDSLD